MDYKLIMQRYWNTYVYENFLQKQRMNIFNNTDEYFEHSRKFALTSLKPNFIVYCNNTLKGKKFHRFLYSTLLHYTLQNFILYSYSCNINF